MCRTHFVGVCKECQKQNEPNRISNTFRTLNSSLYKNYKKDVHILVFVILTLITQMEYQEQISRFFDAKHSSECVNGRCT